MTMIVFKILFCFLFYFYQFNCQKQSYFGWNYVTFLKKRPRPNLKVFQYRIQISAKRSGKQSSSKTNFTTQLLEFYVRAVLNTLVLSKRLNKSSLRNLGQVRIKDNHGQNILKIQFLCEIVHCKKSSNFIFQEFLGSI